MQVQCLPTENQPAPRSGFSLLLLSPTKLVLLGGASHEQGMHTDISILDLETMKWTSTEGFPSRYEFGSALVDGDIFIFGGVGSSGLLNSGHLFDTKTMLWNQCVFKGCVPSPRTVTGLNLVNKTARGTGSGGMVGTCSSKRLYLFGGGSEGVEAVDDQSVYCLDFENMFWVKLTDSTDGLLHPKPRLGHSLVQQGSTLVLFGGMNGTDYYNDVWIFDLDTCRWSLEQFEDSPSPRSGHSMCKFTENRFLVTGGLLVENNSPTVSDQVWELDLDSKSWIRIFEQIPARLNATLIMDPLNSKETDLFPMLLFGGMDLEGIYSDLHSVCVLNLPENS